MGGRPKTRPASFDWLMLGMFAALAVCALFNNPLAATMLFAGHAFGALMWRD